MVSLKDGSIIFDTKVDDSGFREGVKKLGGVAERGAAAAVKGIAAIVSAVTAGVGASIKVGQEFEQSFAKASTLFGDVAVDTDNLTAKMLELSSATGVAATELNEALYSALSAGVPVTEDMADATEFLAGATKLAKAGFTDIDTAVSATAKTLNAYGMDVSEAARVQGILIQTQNKGITTVGELGASLGQVTPTAAAFGVSFENVGAALAVMTASAVPTAQATTQLNSLIAELGKNGTIAAKNLAKAAEGSALAGKSFAEMMASGASLGDVLDLMQKYADKSGVKMLDLFSSIEAGKAAMSAATQGGKKFSDTLKEMQNTAGLVDDAYDKVTDTLQGQTQKAVQSLKNLGIAVYKSLESPMKNAAKGAADAFTRITQSITSGQLKPAVEQLGQSFGTLANALVTLATNVIPILINAFNFIIDHGRGLTAVVVGLTAAFAAYRAAMNIAEVINTVRTGISMITAALAGKTAATAADTVAEGVHTAATVTQTAATEGAAAAQGTLNAVLLATPWGLAIAGVAALVAVIATLTLTTQTQTTATQLEAEAVRELNQAVTDQATARREAKAAADEQASAQVTEVDHVMALWGELQKLADVNGGVGEKDKARAEFILGELSTALGQEFTMTGNLIDNYSTLKGSIDNLIESKKAKIWLDANEQGYKDAILNEAKAYKDLEDAETHYLSASKAVTDQRTKIRDMELQHQQMNDGLQREILKANITAERDRLKSLLETLSTSKQAYDGAASNVRENQELIERYEAASVEAIKGNYQDVIDILSGKNDAFSNSAAVVAKSAEMEATDVERSAVAIQNDVSLFERIGTEYGNSISDSFSDKESEMSSTFKTTVSNAATPAKTTAKEAGKPIGSAMFEGVEVGATARVSGFTNPLISNLTRGLADIARGAIKSKSPSKVFRDKVGKPIPEGIEVGIEKGMPSLSRTMTDSALSLVGDAQNALEIHSPSQIFKNIVGLAIPAGVAEGIEEGASQMRRALGLSLGGLIEQAEEYAAKAREIYAWQRKEDERKAEEDYQERLKNAKDAAEKEKIKQERILEQQKEANDRYLKGVKATNAEEDLLREQAYADLERRRKLGLISEKDYFAELSKMRDQYYIEGSDAYFDETEKIADYNRGILDDLNNALQSGMDSLRDHLSKMADEAKQAADKVASSVSSMAGKLASYGSGLFETKTVTLKGAGRGLIRGESGAFVNESDRTYTNTYLADLKGETEELKRYERGLLSIKDRAGDLLAGGLPDGFFDVLRGMGVDEGIAFTDALLAATDEEFAAFLTDWAEKQRVSQSIAETLYSDEQKAADNMAAEVDRVKGVIKEELEGMGLTVPDGFFDVGKDSAKAFSDGFVEEMATQIQNMYTAVNNARAQFTPDFANGVENGGYSQTTNNYYLQPSDDSIHAQIEEINKNDTIKRLRGE